jgi:RNA polymerase sigma factor (sigma-70 family)
VYNLERVARTAAAGDGQALDELLRVIRPDVLRRCSRILPHPADAEDACQEALLAVARGIGSFGGRSRFTTWLYPVVAHAAFASYRRMRSAAPAAGQADVPEVADPRRVSVIAGTRLDLVDALERLRVDAPHVVDAVVLRDLMGVGYAEIAEHVGVPTGTVKSRINHGRTALRTILGAP